MKLSSEKKLINSTNEKIFQLVSNCSQFGKYLPSDVTNIETTADFCKFEMKSIAQFMIEITEKSPNSLVVYNVGNDKNIPIELKINIQDNQGTSFAELELQADIPFFLQGMVKSPLQKFIDILIEKIKIESEKV